VPPQPSPHVAAPPAQVHLFTGRTLCKLHLPEGGLHADINGDGLVDHVQAHGWHPHAHEFGGAW
jgi:hypothetical protein